MARQRSVRAHDAVLAAARTLFADRGIDATSMDSVAAASGVSKATIYKHWPDKDALCLEVMAQLHGTDATLPDVNTGDLRADLLAVLHRDPPAEHADVRSRIMPTFMAYAGSNPKFGAAWRARVFEPPHIQLRRAIERAVGRGELPAALNLDLGVALLLGPLLYVHIRKLGTGEAPDDFRALVAEAFLRSQGFVPARVPPNTPPPRPRRARQARRAAKKGEG